MRCKPFFAGWYFRVTMPDEGYSCSIIVGVNYTNHKDNSSFIQVIDNKDRNSYFIRYPFNAFKLNLNPFYIQIGKNTFTKDFIYLSISKRKIELHGLLTFDKVVDIKRSLYSPTIMGPFAYIPTLECQHSILSLKHSVNGILTLNGKRHLFSNGIGYIEGDAGRSFPKNYFWMQCNTFDNTDISFVFSIANIPLWNTSFSGHICVFKINSKEHRFATYNGSYVERFLFSNKKSYIILKKGCYRLVIKSYYNNKKELSAPLNGQMTRKTYEDLNGTIKIKLYKKGTLLFQDTGRNCAVEFSGAPDIIF